MLGKQNAQSDLSFLPAKRGMAFLRYLISGVSLRDYYCGGQEIYAPCDGTVVAAKDGYAEKQRTNLLADIANAYRNAHYFDPDKDDEQKIAGNYIILQIHETVYAAFCHLQADSPVSFRMTATDQIHIR